MSLKRPNTLYAGAGVFVALAAMAVFPASVGTAAEMIAAPTLTYDIQTTDPQPVAVTAAPAGDPQPSVAVETADAEPVKAVAAPVNNAERVCMAKVVLHEAGNQSRSGKVAVAQTLMNRLDDGRFGETICDVANQPGQYFDLSDYRPSRESDAWADAMDVASDVLRGETDAVAPGALFFRANYAPTNSFFRGRTRVTQVGAHVFYR
jgi:spore germination cell wall hydrolase CwlJ-like protein